MYKLALQQQLRQLNFPKQKQSQREQEMGLFTFYKQQQQEQNYARTHFANKKKSSIKNPKGKSKFKYLKINSSGRQQQKSRQLEKNKTKEIFLKNINCKVQKSRQNQDRDPIDVQKKLENTKDNQDFDQNQNSTILEMRRQEQSMETNKFGIERSAENRFVSRSLKKIEELLLVSNQRISTKKQKKQEMNEVANQKIDKIIRKIQIQEEIIKTFNKMGLSSNNSRKVCRISLNSENQEKKMLNTFQKSFLKKIRQNANLINRKYTQEKSMRNSKTFQNLHDQNKKYFCNLIDNFYLPHNENNQAAKILRDTLKFPNLVVKNSNLKTEGNLSPVSVKFQKNENRSISCRRNFQSNLKQKLTDFKDHQTNISSNDRFKFLLKKQGTKNGLFRAERLKQKQASLKV